MAVTQETILNLLKQNGPLIPAKLAKHIGTNILIASAYLSNLVDRNQVMISNLKIGGSPVYYIEGQEKKLEEFLSNLNGKDQKTAKLLKEKKVLRDDKLDQLTRVSLRMIKDFAVPLQVTKGNEKLLFWKWYLLSNKEAEELIKKEFEAIPAQSTTENPSIQKEDEALEEKKEEKKRTDEQKKIEDIAAKRNLEEKKKLEEEKRKIEEEKKKLQKEKEHLHKQFALERQKILKEIEEKKKETKKQHDSISEDNFLLQLTAYLKDKKIEIIERSVLKKKSEIDLVLKIPSVVGELEYYCKAKNKKTISDSDISAAVVQGQLKKLPVIFLTTGELTKKAKELLATDFKRSITIRKI